MYIELSGHSGVEWCITCSIAIASNRPMKSSEIPLYISAISFQIATSHCSLPRAACWLCITILSSSTDIQCMSCPTGVIQNNGPDSNTGANVLNSSAVEDIHPHRAYIPELVCDVAGGSSGSALQCVTSKSALLPGEGAESWTPDMIGRSVKSSLNKSIAIVGAGTVI